MIERRLRPAWWPPSAVRIALALWGGLFLVLSPLRPQSGGDLYWQQWLGEMILRTGHLPSALGSETFSAPGAPWIPQEWFLSIVVAIAMRLGLYVPLVLLFAAIVIAILCSIYVRARERASAEAIAIVLLATGIALEASFGVRAQVLGWGCFAAFLYFLQRRDAWFFATIPAVALWANFHASATLAPVFLVARIAGELLDGGVRSPAALRDLRILPFVVLALFCTPLGWHLPAYALSLATSPIRHYIQEWQPVGLGDTEFVFGSLVLAAFAVAGLRGQLLRNKGETLPLVLLFAVMLTARRHVPIFAIAAAPAAAAGLDRLWPGLRRCRDRIAALQTPAMVSVCLAVAIAGVAYAVAPRAAEARSLAKTFSRLARVGVSQRVFCEDFSSCSAALQYPNLRVFIDGRCDPYPLPVWRSYMATIQARRSWEKRLDRYRVDAVVASQGSVFAKALARDPSWRRLFDEGSFAVFRRE